MRNWKQVKKTKKTRFSTRYGSTTTEHDYKHIEITTDYETTMRVNGQPVKITLRHEQEYVFNKQDYRHTHNRYSIKVGHRWYENFSSIRRALSYIGFSKYTR